MIAVLDSGGSNLASVLHAIERLGFVGKFTSDPSDLQQATHWILPGVGSASRAMRKLHDNQLDEQIRTTRKPVLGICLGMQILFESSAEGDIRTMGLISGRVKSFRGLTPPELRLPHLGWNQVQIMRDHPLFAGIPSQSDFYFVHSFAAIDAPDEIGRTEYGIQFTSAVANRNLMGVQFHPERSGTVGQQLIRNFLTLKEGDL